MTIRECISWWAYVARFYARGLWEAVPGPWPVKILLIAVCQLIPGAFDEIALVLITAAWRRPPDAGSDLIGMAAVGIYKGPRGS